MTQIKPARSKKLVGATEPRLHTPLLKGKSRSKEVEDLAVKLGMPLLPWQKFVLKDMMMVDKDGKFTRRTNLLLIARQNGKSHLASMRIIWGLIQGEKIVAMSSNRGMALTTFSNIVYLIESHDWLKEMLASKPRMANGQESVRFKNGGKYEIVAATRDSARGRTANFLFIDELREIGDEGFKAATPVIRATAGQSLFVSNAGDAFSTVLNGLRERAQSYPPKTFGYYEYSAPQFAKINDKAAWALANPALGYLITEDTLEEAVATSTIETTRTEMLCQWIDSLQSPWPHGILEETSDMWQSAVAVDDLKIAADIKKHADLYRPRMICYDKYATASIADRLKNAGQATEDVSGAAFYQACGDLLDGLVNHRVVHSGQAELIQQMNNCAAKNNDSAWRIVKRKSAGDISAPIGIAMVVSQLGKPQSTPMIISV